MNIRISTLALALAVGASFATDPRLEQGNAYAAQGEYDKAIAEYRAVLAEQPRNSEAYFAAGEARMMKKDYSGAIANYRLAYKYEPTMSAAYEGAAKVYEALGQKSKAEAERAKDPKNKPVEEVAQETAPAAETVPAMMPIEAGTTAPTETAAETAPAPATAPAAETAAAPAATAPAETAAPATPEVQTASATATEPQKETAPAQTSPASAVAATEPATASAETPAVPVAEQAPAAAEPAPAVTLPEDPFERGKALLAEGKFKEAAPLWREVLAKHPGHAGAYFYAGVTRYELGEMDKAEFNLKKGLSYKEEGNDANFYLACVYQKTKKEELEKKALAAYLKKAAPDAKFRKQAEERFAALTKPQETAANAVPEETAQATVEAAPATAVASEATAATAETATATAATVAAPTSGPSDEPSVANANNLFRSGDLEGALQMYRALLEKEISPDERYFSMLQMGNIYREMRDFHSAVTRYREVVQQFPDSDWATEAERAMEDAVWLEKHANELPRRVR